MKKDVEKYTDFTPPGVEIHCLHGSMVDTVEKSINGNLHCANRNQFSSFSFRLYYPKTSDLVDGAPTLMNGDGDGTVNLRSLEACTHWIGMKEQFGKNISTLKLPGVDHMGILSDNRIVQYVLGVLVG